MLICLWYLVLHWTFVIHSFDLPFLRKHRHPIRPETQIDSGGFARLDVCTMNVSYQRVEQYFAEIEEALPLWFPIMGSHIRRLGILRVLIGALGMYLSIPVFLLIHVLVVSLLLRWIIYPLLGLGDLKSENYIIVDRYKVKGLPFIDIFHCLFCGWANGLCTLIISSIDTISDIPKKTNPISRFLLTGLCSIYLVPALAIQIVFCFVYNYLIATPLRLEKVHYGALIRQYSQKSEFAKTHQYWTRSFLRCQKICWTGLSRALRQIESAWCPIKHFEKMESVVYPEHHKLFFEPHQVNELRLFLKNHATVMERKTAF